MSAYNYDANPHRWGEGWSVGGNRVAGIQGGIQWQSSSRRDMILHGTVKWVLREISRDGCVRGYLCRGETADDRSADPGHLSLIAGIKRSLPDLIGIKLEPGTRGYAVIDVPHHQQITGLTQTEAFEYIKEAA